MKITITMDLDDQYADPGHAMGITEDGFAKLCDKLGEMGTDIDVRKGASS